MPDVSKHSSEGDFQEEVLMNDAQSNQPEKNELDLDALNAMLTVNDPDAAEEDEMDILDILNVGTVDDLDKITSSKPGEHQIENVPDVEEPDPKLQEMIANFNASDPGFFMDEEPEHGEPDVKARGKENNININTNKGSKSKNQPISGKDKARKVERNKLPQNPSLQKIEKKSEKVQESKSGGNTSAQVPPKELPDTPKSLSVPFEIPDKPSTSRCLPIKDSTSTPLLSSTSPSLTEIIDDDEENFPNETNEHITNYPEKSDKLTTGKKLMLAMIYFMMAVVGACIGLLIPMKIPNNGTSFGETLSTSWTENTTKPSFLLPSAPSLSPSQFTNSSINESNPVLNNSIGSNATEKGNFQDSISSLSPSVTNTLSMSPAMANSLSSSPTVSTHVTSISPSSLSNAISNSSRLKTKSPSPNIPPTPGLSPSQSPSIHKNSSLFLNFNTTKDESLRISSPSQSPSMHKSSGLIFNFKVPTHSPSLHENSGHIKHREHKDS